MNANKVAGIRRRLPLHPADLKDAVWYWADRIGVKVREIHLRQMQRKWHLYR